MTKKADLRRRAMTVEELFDAAPGVGLLITVDTEKGPVPMLVEKKRDGTVWLMDGSAGGPAKRVL